MNQNRGKKRSRQHFAYFPPVSSSEDSMSSQEKSLAPPPRLDDENVLPRERMLGRKLKEIEIGSCSKLHVLLTHPHNIMYAHHSTPPILHACTQRTHRIVDKRAPDTDDARLLVSVTSSRAASKGDGEEGRSSAISKAASGSPENSTIRRAGTLCLVLLHNC